MRAGMSAKLVELASRLGKALLSAYRSAGQRRRCASSSARARGDGGTPLGAGALLALEREELACASVSARAQLLGRRRCAGAKRGLGVLAVPANAARAASASASSCFGASCKLLLGARPRAGDGGELALGLARRPLDGGEGRRAVCASMVCASRQSWRRPLLLGLGAQRAHPRSRARRARCAAAAVRASASSSADARTAGCARRAAARRASTPSAAATNPSHRHRWPSRVTRRWPGFSCGCRREPSAREATMPICFRRRSARAAPSTCAASGSTPAGSAASVRGDRARGASARAPPPRRAPRGRRRARRQAPSRSRPPPDAVEDRREVAGVGADQQLDERLALGLELAERRGCARVLCSRALAAAAARSCVTLPRRRPPAPRSGRSPRQPPARVGDLRELLGVRRPADDLARLRPRARQAGARAWRPVRDALGAARLQALRRARPRRRWR